MEIHEIEARIEMATERLHELAEQLNELEFQGFTEEDSEWLDVACEARMLVGYKAELCAALEERLRISMETNPSYSNVADNSLSNPVSYSNACPEVSNEPCGTKN